jgi:hypothetical protein
LVNWNLYNSIGVPVRWDWQCFLASAYDRANSCVSTWKMDDDERRQIQNDRVDFLTHYRSRIDLSRVGGRRQLNTIRKFLLTQVRSMHFVDLIDNDAVTTALMEVVTRGHVIPRIERNWVGVPRVIAPLYAPQHWPKASIYSVGTGAREPEYFPVRRHKTPFEGSVGGFGEHGGFDWLAAAEETANGFFGGARTNAGGDGLAKNVSDRTRLTDADAFEFDSSLPDADSFDLAGIPFDGDPGWVESGPRQKKQWRMYGPDRSPVVDIDFDDHHGQPNPHAHNWENGRRDHGWAVSVFPR